MRKSTIFWLLGALALGAVAALLVYQHWKTRDLNAGREGMLALMPEEASAVIYADFAELRSSPFFAQLLKWAPEPTVDRDYAQFLQSTGFNYERDLDRVALAVHHQQQNSTVFAVAEGRFDRKKIEAYASQFGSLKTADGKTLFAVPLRETNRKAYFTFLRSDRIAWSNDSSDFFQQPRSDASKTWREHFSRVAGTPVFAVLRQEGGDGTMLAAQAPGNLHSPQLATLLAQLQWISMSAKPEGNLLRVAVEGECLSESTEHQLKDLLSGLVVLAQMGLSDPKTRKELDPGLREGYLELLQSADIQQVDRGTSKTVRVVFDVTPKVLESAGMTVTSADPAAPKAEPKDGRKSPIR